MDNPLLMACSLALTRQRRYREECAVDALIELEDVEEQYQPVMFDDLLAAAVTMLEQEDQGARMRFRMIVVLSDVSTFPMDSGRWKYRALPASQANGLDGCAHDVEAVSFRWACAAACAEHTRNCLGRE